MNWRTHAVTFFLLLFAMGALKLVWSNPKIILYMVLSIVGLLAYGALYIIVKAKMEGSGKK